MYAYGFYPQPSIPPWVRNLLLGLGGAFAVSTIAVIGVAVRQPEVQSLVVAAPTVAADTAAHAPVALAPTTPPPVRDVASPPTTLARSTDDHATAGRAPAPVARRAAHHAPRRMLASRAAPTPATVAIAGATTAVASAPRPAAAEKPRTPTPPDDELTRLFRE